MVKSNYREALGQALMAHRKALGLTVYRVSKDGEMQPNQIASIEDGSTNYTFQSLMGYLSANDLIFKIETKEGDVIFDSIDLI